MKPVSSPKFTFFKTLLLFSSSTLVLNPTQYTLALEHLQSLTNNTNTNESFDLHSRWLLWKNNLYTEEQIDEIDRLLYNIEDLQQVYTVSNFTHLILTASSVIDHVYHGMHRYDDLVELERSTGPKVNQTLCISQLEQLNRRAEAQLAEGFNSKDIDLFRLLDTYGRTPPGFAQIDVVWPGQYKECLRLTIDSNESQTATRYCMASIRFSSWPNSTLSKYYPIKLGVCLPEACDSLNYQNKLQLVQNLIKFNARRLDKDQLEVSSLYCLPDESSPNRSLWDHPKTYFVLFFGGIWVATQIYVTFLISQNKQPQDKGRSLKLRIMNALSIRRNFDYLFEIGREKSTGSEFKLIDLRLTEGIKVLCMLFIIVGHFLVHSIGTLKNIAYLKSVSLDNYLFLVSNQTPSFLVSVFFGVTGITLAYLVCDANQAKSIACNPIKWFFLILKRYLRLAPTYVVVVAYLKYVSKYTGSGPYWDYGTTFLAPRKQCEQEPWFYSVFFLANFRPVLANCVTPAWYIANDMQFLIVSPILIFILVCKPIFGTVTFVGYMLVSCIASSIEILNSDIPDLRPVHRINTVSHGINNVFLDSVYTMPYYRINAYLIGLVFGYWLHRFKQNKIAYLNCSREFQLNPKQDALPPREPRWHWVLVKFVPLFSMGAVLLLIHLAIFNELTFVNDKQLAKVMVAVFFGVLASGGSIAVGAYIVLSASGFGNSYIDSFLSASFWKPLSKMSYSVLLCHSEVVTYIAQTSTQGFQLEFLPHLALLLMSVILSYTVATIMFILVEAPLTVMTKALILDRLIGRQQSITKY